MKLFIDTNIFLDLILKRENYKEALLIFNAIEKNIYEGFVLDITLLNIDYIAKKQVKDVRTFLYLINNNFQIVGASNELFNEALNLKNSDLENNLQYICAKKMSCDLIISNDKDFYSKDIEVLSSLEFVKRFF